MFCEMLESFLKQNNTTRVLNWAESTAEQAPHMPCTFLLWVHNLFANFCDLALDSSAQAKAHNGTPLEPADQPLMTDIFVMFTDLQIALTAASKNNTLGCFNEVPLACKLHCIKAQPKEDDYEKTLAKHNMDKGLFCLKVGLNLFDQHLAKLPMISSRVKGNIKKRKVCGYCCTRGLSCTQRRSPTATPIRMLRSQ
jgi:hypothetical protein